VSDELDVRIPDKMFFRIGELAELVGVEPHVLRYWESEFRIRPQRSPSGQRMYRRKDIARFLRIKSLLYLQGFTIAGARRAMSEAREEGGEELSDIAQLRVARERLDAVQARLAGLRERVERAWDTHLRGADENA
jgi:DNA-binding transcriptional MerR regulator